MLCPGGLIEIDHLPRAIACPSPVKSPAAVQNNVPIQTSERKDLLNALEKTGGNQARAARLPGVSRVTM
ncbi:MAG: helix-turn-helix domain-containing protein [Thermodesulfobacteriota bacterium]